MMDKAREEQVIALCQEMIRQRSYSGQEAGVVEVLPIPGIFDNAGEEA